MPRVNVTELENEEDLTEVETRINKDSKTFHTIYNKMSFPDKLDRPSRTITATCTRVSRESIIIKSDQGNAYAKRATYFVESKIIELYDNVKLEKDGDIIVGDKGEFNVFTGKGEISVVPSKKGGSKKVYGIIKSKKK